VTRLALAAICAGLATDPDTDDRIRVVLIGSAGMGVAARPPPSGLRTGSCSPGRYQETSCSPLCTKNDLPSGSFASRQPVGRPAGMVRDNCPVRAFS
jgi:hypothetical protein